MLTDATKIQAPAGFEITFQPVCNFDEDFLLELYIETRAEEFVSIGWDKQQLGQFLGMQYQMQVGSYKMQHPNARHFLIICGQRIGRLIIDRSDTAVSLVDISLLRSAQKRGIGTSIVGWLIEDAREADLVLTLQVSAANTGARRLYERLGFYPVRHHEMYTEMEWRKKNGN